LRWCEREACGAAERLVFGSCDGLMIVPDGALGQGMVEHFGGKLDVLDYPMHGKASRIEVVEGEGSHRWVSGMLRISLRKLILGTAPLTVASGLSQLRRVRGPALQVRGGAVPLAVR
jgi:hypothetical protein